MNNFGGNKDGPVLVSGCMGLVSWEASQLIWASGEPKKCGVVVLVDVVGVEHHIGHCRTGEMLELAESALVAWLGREAPCGRWALYKTRSVEIQMQRLGSGCAVPRNLHAMLRGQRLGRGLEGDGAKTVSLIHQRHRLHVIKAVHVQGDAQEQGGLLEGGRVFDGEATRRQRCRVG
jgi:hypothetical protein